MYSKDPKRLIIFDGILLLMIGLVLLKLTWGKWGGPIWDLGREVYIPWRIGLGEVLYKDLAYLYGAFPPYWNALLFKVFGPYLLTLSLWNILIAALDVMLIYRFFYKAVNRTTALMTSLVFLSFFVFNNSYMVHNMYYLNPYSHSVFYAIFFALCALNIFQSLLEQYSKKMLFLLGFFLSFMLLSRLEIFLAFIIPILMGFFAFCLKKKLVAQEFRKSLAVIASLPDRQAGADGAWQSETLLKNSGILLLGFLLPLGAFLFYFSSYFSISQALINIIGYNPHWKQIENSFIYQNLGGFLSWQSNLYNMGTVVLWYGILFGALHVFCQGMRLAQSGKHRIWGGLLISLFTGILLYTVRLITDNNYIDIFNGWALVVYVMVYESLKKYFSNDKDNSNQALSMIVCCGWALLMMIKVPFQPRPIAYGLIYNLPGILLSAAYITDVVPRIFERRYALGWMVSVLINVMLVLAYTSIIFHSLSWIDLKKTRVGQGANALWSFDKPFSNEAGGDFNQFLKWADGHLNFQDNFVVMPDGIMLNFLSKHTTSTPYVSFMPVEVMRYGEGNMLEALKRHPPNYIVIIYSSMITYGNIVLGYNYLYNINNWTQKNYQEVWRSTRVNRKDQLYIRVFKSKIIGIKLSK